MTLPRALQASLEEADRIVAAIGGEPPEPLEPGEQPPAPVANRDNSPAGDPDFNPPPTLPAPAAPVQAAPPPPAPEPDDTWKHKYNTLQGLFNAEMPKMQAQLRELSGQLGTLSTENQFLKAELAKKPEPTLKEAGIITDADRETFGAELVDLIERATSPNVRKTDVDQVLNRIKELELKLGNVSENQASANETAFWKNLTRNVPDWEAINTTDAWKAWLLEVDPIYGMSRQAGLDVAFNRMDGERVATIFNTYKNTRPAPPPTPQQELQRQVTPTRSRASTEAPAGAQGGMLWTSESITALYNDIRKGVLSAEDAAMYEADLNRAAEEGRIRE